MFLGKNRIGGSAGQFRYGLGRHLGRDALKILDRTIVNGIGAVGARENRALEVAQHDAARRSAEKIIGHQRYFSTASRRINHKLRNAQTSRVPAKPFHYFEPFPYAGSQMRSADN